MYKSINESFNRLFKNVLSEKNKEQKEEFNNECKEINTTIKEGYVNYNIDDHKGSSKENNVIKVFSLAYNKDFKEVKKDANVLLKDYIDSTLYYKGRNNYSNIFRDLLEKYGYVDMIDVKPNCSIKNFAESYHQGVWIVLCYMSDKTSYYVCIINGNYYDSNDIGDYYVEKAWWIRSKYEENKEENEDINYWEFIDDLMEKKFRPLEKRGKVKKHLLYQVEELDVPENANIKKYTINIAIYWSLDGKPLSENFNIDFHLSFSPEKIKDICEKTVDYYYKKTAKTIDYMEKLK